LSLASAQSAVAPSALQIRLGTRRDNLSAKNIHLKKWRFRMVDEEKLESQGAKSNETPEEKFVRIANLRVPNAIKKIKLIGNLSASAYRCSPEQIDKIIASLRQAVDEVGVKFKKGSKSSDQFSL
jgi:hypothetical protein